MNALVRDPKQMGNQIRRARKKKAWSQKVLGEKAGLRQETISLIETGNPSVRLETLLAILAALDLEFRVGLRSKGWEEDTFSYLASTPIPLCMFFLIIGQWVFF